MEWGGEAQRLCVCRRSVTPWLTCTTAGSSIVARALSCCISPFLSCCCADLKCENVLVFPGNNDGYLLKLADFGLSFLNDHALADKDEVVPIVRRIPGLDWGTSLLLPLVPTQPHVVDLASSQGPACVWLQGPFPSQRHLLQWAQSGSARLRWTRTRRTRPRPWTCSALAWC